VIYSGILQHFVVQLLFFVSSVVKSLSLADNNKLCSSIRGFSVTGRQWVYALLEPSCHVARLIFSILEEILIQYRRLFSDTLGLMNVIPSELSLVVYRTNLFS
jgi:hypothetical protein